MSDRSAVSHALYLVSRLKRMKEREVVCDFHIKIGSKSFPVHRTILVACSDYFEGMFSSNMREVGQGYLELHDVEINAFERCLEFMYTGITTITMVSVQDILHAAELFQLGSLKNQCFQFLMDNLSPDCCLSVINLANTYNRQDVCQAAERFVSSNFNAVISSEMFTSISRHDLLRYIVDTDYRIKWKAIKRWGKGKDEFLQLIEALDLKIFPFQFLLQTVLEERLIRKCRKATDLVICQIFSNAEDLERNLSSSNCLTLKFLARKLRVTEGVKSIIDRSVHENFGEIMSLPMFSRMNEIDVVTLFQSTNTRYSSEMHKWKAALTWVKHDIANRKKIFPCLFRLLKFEHFSINYLENTISEEPLVKDSRQCRDVLMKILFARASGSASVANPRPGAVAVSMLSSMQKPRVQVKRIIGCKGGGPGCLCEPWGLSVTGDGNIVVADAGNHRVQILDPTGQSVNCFGTKGSGPGQFLCPCDVSLSSSGHIAVADHHNHRIQIFDAEGNFVREFGKQGQGKVTEPWSVSVARNDHVFVGSCNHTVGIFCLNGRFVREIAGNRSPIAYGSEMYVFATQDGKVLIIQAYGGCLWAYNERGDELWEKDNLFTHERGIAGCKNGNILTGNNDNNKIRIFNAVGDPIMEFGGPGSQPGQFDGPRGMAVLQNGDIAVSDSGNHRIQIFSIV